jgi:hypothetical protein
MCGVFVIVTGTYNERVNSNLTASCVPCPQRTTTEGVGSDSKDSCTFWCVMLLYRSDTVWQLRSKKSLGSVTCCLSLWPIQSFIYSACCGARQQNTCRHQNTSCVATRCSVHGIISIGNSGCPDQLWLNQQLGHQPVSKLSVSFCHAAYASEMPVNMCHICYFIRSNLEGPLYVG